MSLRVSNLGSLTFTARAWPWKISAEASLSGEIRLRAAAVACRATSHWSPLAQA